ncbi:MAG: metalloregulator ArsR/SmtB family transcription factor [Anaerolineae bacterium]|nr:metalloregulator ArsR/SmtB family transcription factor [Anaerolineae bacterium]MDW8100173.1 metalloregulator ArsR/SmtB family transcription factor [Anaerolineae bacterium]
MLTNDPVAAEGAASVAHALAHPIRLQILELLRDQGAYVMHLTAALGRPQANISQHLAVLREAGLVVDEREGTTTIYRVRDQRVFELVDSLKALVPEIRADLSFRSRRVRFRQGGRLNGSAQSCRCPRCRGFETA